MGDVRAWSPEPNGAVPVGPSNGTAVEAEYWRTAEAATQEIIEKVQATTVSEERRRAVVDYVQRLIRSSTCCQVFPFGSVPLKTYLPDGDIDLTAVSCLNVGEEALANEVCTVLEREDQNHAAEFVVKDVQLIRAEVKLVKCLVQNIVVDISFNQLGGLSTLCFLEKVARLIGKDHLFKRSIVLIKAWCYYESRILGAHHGLISTYALETLVLYVFNLFHSSLNGPLAVLYKFLEYFSKFDWDNYCISLNGPVRIASLPEFFVERPEISGCDMLLSSDFFKECVQTFSVPARGFEANSRVFSPKHLNIVDPLRENNNLGRSVSKGNFYRIRSAFTYGARKLGHILSLPEENVACELQNFFSNTLDRHGRGQRPDVQDPVPFNGTYGFGTSFSCSSRESNHEDHILPASESVDLSGVIEERADYTARKTGNEMSSSEMANEESNTANWTAVSENRLNGDATDLATSRVQGLSISKDVLNACPSSLEPSKSPTKIAYHAPHLHFSHPTTENGELGNGISEWKRLEHSGLPNKRYSSEVLPVLGEDMTRVLCADLDGKLHTDQESPSSVGYSPFRSKNHQLYFSSVAQISEDFCPGCSGDQPAASTAGSPEAFNCLADLSGDYDCHLNSLHNGRCLYEYALNTPLTSIPPTFLSQLQNRGTWDLTRQSAKFDYRRNAISLGNGNIVPGPVLYVNTPLVSGTAFGIEEMPKPRGTGTYFPNTNHYRERGLATRGRQQASVRSPRSNGRTITSQESSLPERNSREQSQSLVLNHRNGGKSGSSDLRQPSALESKSYSQVNGTSHPPDRVMEFGALGQSPPGPFSVETGRQLNPGSVPPAQSTSASIPAWGSQRPRAVTSLHEQDRIDIQSYELKDEDDFPPLTDSSGKGLAPFNVKSSKS